MGGKRPVSIAISLDVEEEGLFRGAYPAAPPKMENARHLVRLAPIFDRGAKITLFCAHCAFVQKPAYSILEKMRHDYPVEIGAHLHHWNTPCQGYEPGRILRKPWTSLLSSAEMENRLASLLAAAGNFLGKRPTVFRMGRWDLLRRHWPLLANAGIRFDASVRPLHSFPSPQGPDHFNAPADPYLVKVGQKEIAEIPCTVTPLCKPLTLPKIVRNNLRKWGALALLPVEHPLWLMKLTTLSHLKRGGKTLSLTWHSSELMPGGNPALPNEQSVTRFVKKICAYLDWLDKNFALEYLTISEMGQAFAKQRALGRGDWTFNMFNPERSTKIK